MIFGRREKRPALLTFDRILVPLAGTEADDAALRLAAPPLPPPHAPAPRAGPEATAAALRLAAILLAGTPGKAFLLHVIEIPFERQLDAPDPAAGALPARGPRPAP